MTFLASLDRQRSRYLEVNGHPRGPAPGWKPAYVPEPPSPSWRERLWARLGVRAARIQHTPRAAE